MHEDDRDGNASFSLRTWAEFSKCCCGDGFSLSAFMLVVTRLSQNRESQKAKWQSPFKDTRPPWNPGMDNPPNMETSCLESTYL